MSLPRRAFGHVAAVVRGARDDRVTGLAGEVAYFGMLSVFPGLIALATAVTLLDRLGAPQLADDVERSVVGWMTGLLTSQGSGVVDAVRGLFERSNGDVFSISLLIAVWSGSRGIDAVVEAIVLVANDVDRRSWARRRLLSIGLLVGTVIAASAVLSMFVVGPLLGGGRALAEHFGFGVLFVTWWTWVRLPLAALALFVWALTMLHLARPQAGRWRDDAPGAAATTALWITVSLGLRFYLDVAGATNAVLGTLGGALISLVWLYLLALSLLVGAEIAQHQRERQGRATPRSHAYPWSLRR